MNIPSVLIQKVKNKSSIQYIIASIKISNYYFVVFPRNENDLLTHPIEMKYNYEEYLRNLKSRQRLVFSLGLLEGKS